MQKYLKAGGRSSANKCMRNLKYHKVAFEENLEELLLPLIADEDKLQQLLNNPGRVPLFAQPPKNISKHLDRNADEDKILMCHSPNEG